MFDIEEVADRMVRIDDVYIPAVNLQVEGYPAWNGGTYYPIYFEIMWEYVDCWWVIEKDDHTDIIVRQFMDPKDAMCIAQWNFKTWSDFKEFFLKARVDELKGFFMEEAMAGIR